MLHNKAALSAASKAVENLTAGNSQIDQNFRESALSIDARHTDSTSKYFLYFWTIIELIITRNFVLFFEYLGELFQLFSNAENMERKDAVFRCIVFYVHEIGQGLFFKIIFSSSWTPWNYLSLRRTTFSRKH